MDLVFEGKLSSSWGMKDLLKAVQEVPGIEMGLLRLTALNFSGKILISQSKHIVGASGSDGSSGYDPLRSLLELEDAGFAYLDSSLQAPAEPEQTLYIKIEHLRLLMPGMQNLEELFDQKALLDRIFGDKFEAGDPARVRFEDSVQVVEALGLSVEATSDSKTFSFEPNAMTIDPGAFARGTSGARDPKPAAKAKANGPSSPINKQLLDSLPPSAGGGSNSSLNMLPDYVQTGDFGKKTMNKLRGLEPEPESEGFQHFIKTQQDQFRRLLHAFGFKS